jgi:hypothetical protein
LKGNCLHIDGGSQQGGSDATVYITATNNNDWGLIVNKSNSSATEYGIDARMGASANAAYYARFGGCVRFQVAHDCLCHNVMIKSPAIYGGSFVNSAKFCSSSSFFCSNCMCIHGTIKSTNCICASGHVCGSHIYGDGSNLTGISAGYNPMNNTNCHNGGTDCNNIIFGKCAAERNLTSGDIAHSVIIGRCAGYYACGSTHVMVGALAGRGYFCSGCNHTGFENVMIGYNAGSNGYCKDGSCKWCKNVFVGSGSGGSQPHAGEENTIIGAEAGTNLQGGACGNILIGYYAGYNCTTGNNALVIGSYKQCSGAASICYSQIGLCGTVYKSGGSFLIAHPDPAKRETKDLLHSFVESPTEGDNIYRWQVDVQNCRNVITLPDYYRFLNKDDMVWVSPYKNFGSAYGEVTEDQKCLIVCSNEDGKYNVLLIGTRKDACAVKAWNGTERDTFEMSPDMETVFEWGQDDDGNQVVVSQERHRAPDGPDYSDW